MSDIVTIEVGGTNFKTTFGTLKRYKNRFRTMLKEHPRIEEIKKYIFIDRSPKHFETILNYLRDGKVPLPDSRQTLEEIEMKQFITSWLLWLTLAGFDWN